MINKSGKPTKVVCSAFKTIYAYNQQVFTLNPKLCDMIQKYIENEKMNFAENRWIFSNPKHTSPSKESSNFSTKIQSVFNSVYDVKDAKGEIEKIMVHQPMSSAKVPQLCM